MTVKDLIDRLKSMDSEMEVLVSWDCEVPGDLNSTEIKNIEDMYGDMYDGFPDKWVEINGSY